MERGNCHFVEKARNAQAISATAAVIYNTDDSSLPVMADDGSGTDVHIPSLIISQTDAVSLFKTMNQSSVVVGITWEVPHPDNRVEWSLWDTSRDRRLRPFMESFRFVFQALGNHTLFSPHYEVYDGSALGCFGPEDFVEGGECAQLCLTPQVCTYDPESDTTIGLDGVDVLKEDQRQLCIWKQVSERKSAHLWWDYVTVFDKECSVQNATKSIFNRECSERIQKKLGIDSKAVQDCITTNGTRLLTDEAHTKMEYGVISVPRLLVNDLQHYGEIMCPVPIDLGSCSPLRMICSGFQTGTAPPACNNAYWKSQCFEKRDACGKCLDPVIDASDWNQSCTGCDGIVNSGKVFDICGVCGGDGSFDSCGKCLPKASAHRDKSCVDCNGVPNGPSKVDPCGVCDGHGSFDACGLCLDQYDPRRQNVECKVESDPNAIRVKVLLRGIRVADFNSSAFRKGLSGLLSIPQDNVLIKSTFNDRNSTGCIVYCFIAAQDDKEEEHIVEILKKSTTQTDLAVRMKSLSPSLGLGGIQTMSVEEKSADKNNARTGSSSSTVWILILVGAVAAVGAVVVRRREAKLRGDFHRMFAKYTPLSTMDDDSLHGEQFLSGQYSLSN